MQPEPPPYIHPSVRKPEEVKKERVLLVEGRDELNYFTALLKFIHLEDHVQIIEIGGKDKFLDTFPAFLNLPGFNQITAYAIIRDADDSHINTYESIKGLLKKYGQPCPPHSNAYYTGNGVKVGIFILPGNAETGMLESLCLQTIANHPAMPCVEDFMRCINANLEQKPSHSLHDTTKMYRPKNGEKAKLLAFLATLHEATTSIGIAAQKGYWPFDHEALANLRAFLRELID